MTNGFIELTDVESFDRFLNEAKDTPVIIFKHSNSCGISAGAYREMTGVQQPVGLVTVQKARDLSREIEHRYAVPHESPQVLVLRGGKVVWSASHGGIRSEAVESAAKDPAIAND